MPGQHPPGGAQARFEVGTLLDAAPLGRVHLRIVLLAMAAIVLDGFDLQVLGYAAPALIAEWGIQRADLAPIFAAGMVGVALGGLVIGPRGDIWGRRRALVASVGFFGITTLACAWARSPTEMLVLRLLAGIGLGGALANATALVTETAPLRWRSLLTTLTLVGVPVGGVLGGELAARLIPAYGWGAVFVIGGVVPIALAVALYLWLPESVRFLLRSGSGDAAPAVNALCGEARFTHAEPLWLSEPPAQKASFRQLLAPSLARDTLGVWTIFLGNLFAMFCFFNWLPSVLIELGYDMSAASRLLGLYNLGGIGGALLSAWLMRHHGSRGVLSAAAIIAVCTTLAMGRVDLGVWANALALCLLAGVCINAIQIGAYVLTAHIYPTPVRATGLGAAVAMGRVGALASSFAGALVGAGASTLFLIIAASMLFALIGILMVRGHLTPHREAAGA